jgi:hypothetical protein
MARRFYSSIAERTALAVGVNDSVGTLIVDAVNGWPASTPYTLIIDVDTVLEEVVTVTARSGTTLTVTRGVDGTTAKAHDAGADVRHGVSARDFDEPNDYINTARPTNYYQASPPGSPVTGDLWMDSDDTA